MALRLRLRRLLLTALLVLDTFVTAVTAAHTTTLPVVLVSVEHSNGLISDWDDLRVDRTLASVNDALRWLRVQGIESAPAKAEIVGELTITEADLNDASLQWVPASGGRLILYVVSTAQERGALLAGGLYGVAIYPDGAVAVLDSYRGKVENLPALVAHELLHQLYGLPDWEELGPCQTDIMCTPLEAYRVGTLGCQTLEVLGRPCQRTHLPLLVGGR